MEEIVDARDVLDANARTCRVLLARTLGHFVPTGPDSWDPFRFVSKPGEVHEVLPGLKVQVEPEGAVFRMRRNGEVLRVEWQPGDDDRAAAAVDQRAAFLQNYVTSFQNPTGRGARAIIATRLKG